MVTSRTMETGKDNQVRVKASEMSERQMRQEIVVRKRQEKGGLSTRGTARETHEGR